MHFLIPPMIVASCTHLVCVCHLCLLPSMYTTLWLTLCLSFVGHDLHKLLWGNPHWNWSRPMFVAYASHLCGIQVVSSNCKFVYCASHVLQWGSSKGVFGWSAWTGSIQRAINVCSRWDHSKLWSIPDCSVPWVSVNQKNHVVLGYLSGNCWSHHNHWQQPST